MSDVQDNIKIHTLTCLYSRRMPVSAAVTDASAWSAGPRAHGRAHGALSDSGLRRRISAHRRQMTCTPMRRLARERLRITSADASAILRGAPRRVLCAGNYITREQRVPREHRVCPGSRRPLTAVRSSRTDRFEERRQPHALPRTRLPRPAVRLLATHLVPRAHLERCAQASETTAASQGTSMVHARRGR